MAGGERVVELKVGLVTHQNTTNIPETTRLSNRKTTNPLTPFTERLGRHIRVLTWTYRPGICEIVLAAFLDCSLIKPNIARTRWRGLELARLTAAE